MNSSKNEGRSARVYSKPGVLAKAAEVLEGYAHHSLFVASYARMNPKSGLKKNAFFFAPWNGPPRAVIFGPWLYVHAPGLKANELEPVSEDERRAKHLGALHARLRLLDDVSVELVSDIARRIRALARGQAKVAERQRGRL